MRIIAGEFRSRLLTTPADNETTRPIPDRVKESLFAILRGHTEDAVIFDAFAGTGAIGLEALSRGAARCVFVEKDKRIASILQKNIDTLGVKVRAELVIGDALGPGALARCPRGVNLVFFDPPYPLVREPIGFKRVMAQFAQLVARLDPNGYAILRTPWPFFLEVAESPAEPDPAQAHPKKDRRAKELDRAMRNPELAARALERQARRSPVPPAMSPPTPSSDKADHDEPHDEHFDNIDLDELRAENDAELPSDPHDPERELTEAEIREMMNLPDARPLSEHLAEAGLIEDDDDAPARGRGKRSRESDLDRGNASATRDEIPDDDISGDDFDDELDGDDVHEDLDAEDGLDLDEEAEHHRSSKPARHKDSHKAGKHGDEPDVHITKSRPKIQKLDASLAIPGVRGPETHIYGSMAIHLYMRE